MKKVFSVLLAVCLFATMLVPAFAFTGKPEFGNLSDVAKVEFDKTSYKLEDITKDGVYVDVSEMLTAWDKNGNRTNYNGAGQTNTEIRAYWTNNNEVLTIDDAGRITRLKPKLSADTTVQLRVTLASGKQATTNIVVPANKNPDSADAYGYRLKNVEVQEGMLFTGSDARTATLTYTASATPRATTLTITGATYSAGTTVALAAGDTAAANAEAVHGGITQITVKGIRYAPKAYVADATTVVFESIDYVGAELPQEYVPNAEELRIITTSVTGSTGAVVATPPGQIPFYTSDAMAVAAASDWIKVGNVQTAFDTDANTTVKAAAAAYNAANPNGPLTASDATNTIIFTAKDNFPVLKADVPVVKFYITNTEATATFTPTSEAKGVYTLTPAAANGVKRMVIAGEEVILHGNESAELVTTRIKAALGTTVVINGFTYDVDTGTTTTVVFSAQKAGTDSAGMGAAVGNPAVLVVIGSGTSSLAFSAGGDSANNNPFIYNIDDEITPILSSYKFNGDQMNAFRFAVRVTANGDNAHFQELREDAGIVTVANYGLQFRVSRDADNHPRLEIAANPGTFNTYKNTYVYVRVLNDQFSNAQTEKEFSIKLVGNEGDKDSILPASANVAVGKTLDLRTLNKSVDGVDTYWAVQPYGNYQTRKEAAMIAKMVIETVDADNFSYGWSVKGLAPGVVTIGLYNSKRILVDTMKLNVGPGAPTDGVPTAPTATATVKVNENVKLTVKNLNSDQYVKWSVDNNNAALANFDGASVTIYGKKTGTVVVTAKVYESKKAATDGKDPINTFKTSVTVKAAESKPVTTPTTPTAPTGNPQTGDAIFANLLF